MPRPQAPGTLRLELSSVKPKSKGSSLAIETRRLLRHLDTPKRLRHNVLVGHLFEEHSQQTAVAAIRALVERALEAMVAQARYSKHQRVLRYREIVRRYDLCGESAYAVASDLGLSMRHFYRERNAACADLGAILQQLVPARATHSVFSVYEVAEAAAFGVFANGAPQKAAEQFLSLASEQGDPLARVAALCDAAIIFIELYDVPRAKELVSRALSIVNAERLSPPAEAEARALVGIAEALSRWDAGYGDESRDLAYHTMQSAHRFIHELSGSGLRHHAGECLRFASRALAAGNPASALKLLRESEPFIDLLGQRVPYVRVDYANIRAGELRYAGNWEEMAHLSTTAYEESRRLGYLVGAATAARSLAVLLAQAGDLRAIELADSVVELARANNSPRMLAYAQIGAAEIHTMMNGFARALELLRDAGQAVQGDQLQVQRARDVRLKALTGLRQGKLQPPVDTRKLPRS